MPTGELELIRWLEHTLRARRATEARAVHIATDIGDDLAGLDLGGVRLYVGSDVQVDGTHFDRATDRLEDIGGKAMAACLSDCAAMAVRPVAAVVSLLVPHGQVFDCGRPVMSGVLAMAGRHGCAVVGGDTTSCNGPLAVDVCVIATPWPDAAPVTRSGARAGDLLWVTGPLGGSRRGRHLTFEPRIHEAHLLSRDWPLRAMIDISDGLALDLWRLCQASGCGARLQRSAVQAATSADAIALSAEDGVPPLQHALADGEDFELLLAASGPGDRPTPAGVTLYPIGTILAEAALELEEPDGTRQPLRAEGYRHQ